MQTFFINCCLKKGGVSIQIYPNKIFQKITRRSVKNKQIEKTKSQNKMMSITTSTTITNDKGKIESTSQSKSALLSPSVWGESLYKLITFFIRIASMEEFLIQILKRNTSQPLTTGEQKNSFSFFDLGSYIITSISNDAQKTAVIKPF